MLSRKRPGRRADDDEDENPLSAALGPKKFHVSISGPDEGPNLYNVFIYSEITKPEQFIDAIECLQAATEDDTILIHISTPGGSIDATDTFLHALKGARARVVFIASGGVHSAGSIILMHAKEISFSSGFNSLIHNGSVGFGAKYSDFKSAMGFVTKHMEVLFRDVYAGFLTPSEIDDLIAGKDYWMDQEEFQRRLLQRNELINKANEMHVV